MTTEHQVETLTGNDTRTKTCRHYKRQHSKRDIVQAVKTSMRKQAELRRKEARMTRTRNLQEYSSDSDSGMIYKINFKVTDHNFVRKFYLKK